MNKHIVTLSDTSHPFTQTTANEDNTTRTLSKQEFRAVDSFLRDWGYNGNVDMSDDLVDMLADEDTPVGTLITRFMRKWDLSGEIRLNVQNLFVLRSVVMSDNPRILHFSDDEVKALESLEGEKSDESHIVDEIQEQLKSDIWTEKPLTLAEYNKAGKSSRELLFQEEADKRVTRYFIGQTGWAWYVHFIVDMPEDFDTIEPNLSKSLYQAKDGRTTLHMTSLYMSEEKAWERINEDIRTNTAYDYETLTHVVELDKF